MKKYNVVILFSTVENAYNRFEISVEAASVTNNTIGDAHEFFDERGNLVLIIPNDRVMSVRESTYNYS